VAAAQSHADAHFNLCYEHGMGVAQDLKLAVDWYANAAA
jgi:TPR repeat protein